MKNYALNASYALESRWLNSRKCNESPPDIIYNSTTISNKDQTLWYQFTIGNPRICAATHLDCASPGVCLSSLNTNLTYFYSSSMIYMFPNLDHNYTSGVYGLPSKTKGHTYCSIMSELDSYLFLTRENYISSCYGVYDEQGSAIAGFGCTPDSLLIYDDDLCTGNILGNYSTTFKPTPIDGFGNYSYMYQKFDSEPSTKVVWEKYYPLYLSVPIGSYLSIFIAFMVLTFIFPFLSTIDKTIKLVKTFKPKYFGYVLSFVTWMIYFAIWTFQVCRVFLDSEQLAITSQFMGLSYMLATGITISMNTYILNMVVLRERKGLRKYLNLAVLVAYVGLAGPFLFKVCFFYFIVIDFRQYIFQAEKYSTNSAVTSIYYNWVKPTDGYWQIFTLVYEPSCAIVTLLYIYKTLKFHSVSAHEILFSNRVFAVVFVVFNVNLVAFVTLKCLENYSVVYGNDYAIFAVYSFFQLQYALNAVCSAELVEQIPQIINLIRMVNESGEGKVKLKNAIIKKVGTQNSTKDSQSGAK